MKPAQLTSEEECLVNCEKEKILLEIIKGMDLKEMKSFDCYQPRDLKHYNSLEKYWCDTERHLIRDKLHKEPNDLELIEDAKVNHNFERFRVWYVLNFPEKVKRKD